MLDLVPFAGGRRIMRHRNRDLLFIGKLLELLLPQPISDPVGTAPIGGNEQFALLGIERFAGLLPPSPDTSHGKRCRVMIDPYVDEASVMNQIINAVRNSFAIGERKKVVHIDVRLLSFGLPLPPVVLEGAYKFFFLQSTEMIGSPHAQIGHTSA